MNLKHLCLSILLVSFYQLKASNYYFSTSTGDDTRSASEAQNPSTPWKTISRLNEIISSLNPGDSVLFKRGDVFTGSISLSRSGNGSEPIVFGAYGTGDKPVISGLTCLSGWTSAGSNIWEAPASAKSMINVVLLKGSAKAIGRYPNSTAANKGYLKYDSYSGSTSITDDALSSMPDWDGGEVVIRKNRWVLDRNTITQHSGNTINYTSQSGYGASKGYGYFIQNHPRTLDTEGEWYYSKSAQKLGIYLTSNPGTSVQASTIDVLVSISGQSNIVFSNLSFEGANSAAFDLKNAQQIRISNCEILNSGINAINASSTTGLVVEYTAIDHTNNIAINQTWGTGTILSGNKITNTGMNPGMGGGDSGSYEAVMLTGDNNEVTLNEIGYTGYIPVTFRGNSNIIQNNYIHDFTLVKDDGGGIYTWNNVANAPLTYGNKIKDNVVLNGTGAGAGTDNVNYLPANGIYLDDNTANTEISGNTVANCRLNGIYIHNAHELTVTGNTLFNNGSQVILSRDANANSPVRNISMNNNIFFSKEASQPVARFETPVTDILSFGKYDNNYYLRPLNDNFTIGTVYQLNGVSVSKSVSLDQWKLFSGLDQASHKSPASVSSADQIRFEYNGSASKKSIDLGQQSYIDATGQNFTGKITLDPYSSIVLILKSANTDDGSANCSATGSILREEWDNAPGNDVSSIPLTKDPTSSSQINALETVEMGDQYGARIRGYICPPQSGNYTFYISGDDAAELWLSTDDKPANKVKIAYFLSYTDYHQFDKFGTQTSKTIYLKAGTKYYLEVLHKEGGGGDNVTVGWKKPDGTIEAPIPGSRLSPYGSNNGSSGPVQTPSTTCSATGSVLREEWDNVTGNNISDIPLNRSISSSSQITVLETTQMGNLYGDRIRGYVCAPQTGAYTFFISGDDAAELWLSTDSNSSNKVKVAYLLTYTGFRQFNKYPSQTSAPINLQQGQKYYFEVLHKEGGGGDHLTVGWNLPDGTPEFPLSGSHLSPYAPSSTLPVITQCSATGSILREEWDHADGNDVSNIPLSRTPDVSSQITNLETTSNGDNYGDRIRGYLCVPQSGNYTFYISGDDAAELWLSTDDEPDNKVKIAYFLSYTNFREFNKFSTQISAPVSLIAGKKYYIEALHKEGGGGDHLTVGWKLPDGTTEIPVPGNRLSSYTGAAYSNIYVYSTQNGLYNSSVEGNAALSTYPNPVSGTATVQYTPATSGITTIDVYDLNGKLIRNVYKGQMDAGHPRTFQLDASGLANGMYLLKAITKSGSISSKLQVIR